MILNVTCETAHGTQSIVDGRWITNRQLGRD